MYMNPPLIPSYLKMNWHGFLVPIISEWQLTKLFYYRFSLQLYRIWHKVEASWAEKKSYSIPLIAYSLSWCLVFFCILYTFFYSCIFVPCPQGGLLLAVAERSCHHPHLSRVHCAARSLATWSLYCVHIAMLQEGRKRLAFIRACFSSWWSNARPTLLLITKLCPPTTVTWRRQSKPVRISVSDRRTVNSEETWQGAEKSTKE